MKQLRSLQDMYLRDCGSQRIEIDLSRAEACVIIDPQATYLYIVAVCLCADVLHDFIPASRFAPTHHQVKLVPWPISAVPAHVNMFDSAGARLLTRSGL